MKRDELVHIDKQFENFNLDFFWGVAVVVCVWVGFGILSWKAFLSSIEPLLSAFHLISENDEQGRSIGFGYHVPHHKVRL